MTTGSTLLVYSRNRTVIYISEIRPDKTCDVAPSITEIASENPRAGGGGAMDTHNFD